MCQRVQSPPIFGADQKRSAFGWRTIAIGTSLPSPSDADETISGKTRGGSAGPEFGRKWGDPSGNCDGHHGFDAFVLSSTEDLCLSENTFARVNLSKDRLIEKSRGESVAWSVAYRNLEVSLCVNSCSSTVYGRS